MTQGAALVLHDLAEEEVLAKEIEAFIASEAGNGRLKQERALLATKHQVGSKAASYNPCPAAATCCALTTLARYGLRAR